MDDPYGDHGVFESKISVEDSVQEILKKHPIYSDAFYLFFKVLRNKLNKIFTVRRHVLFFVVGKAYDRRRFGCF